MVQIWDVRIRVRERLVSMTMGMAGRLALTKPVSRWVTPPEVTAPQPSTDHQTALATPQSVGYWMTS